MTSDELARCDGREGRRAFVAVSGKVYDVTDSPHWQGGDHKGAHRAGGDLTEELKSAPHIRAVIERFPVVGTLETRITTGKKGGGGAVVLAVAVLLAIAALLLIIRS